MGRPIAKDSSLRRWPPSANRMMTTGLAFTVVGVSAGVILELVGNGQWVEPSTFVIVGLTWTFIGWRRGGSLRSNRVDR